MKALALLLFALGGLACAQEVPPPLASFSGTVRKINSTTLTLARPDQDDLEVYLNHKTKYFNGSQKIKRDQIKPGDHVSVETALDLLLKPQAVNVRRLPPENSVAPAAPRRNRATPHSTADW